MDINIKADWLKALRSGSYRQGKGSLKFKDDAGFKHCCLGVLCELAVQAGVIPASKPRHPIDTPRIHQFAGKRDVLPMAVVEWAGLHGTNPTVEVAADVADGIHGRTLAGLNDGPHDFSFIADVIERGL
jgi:hypothetical protein